MADPKYLDISSHLSARNRIYRVGIELEGGWNKIPPGTQIQRDGSVIIPDDNGRLRVGELPSPAMEPTKVAEWTRTFYPSHVNATCGMHVHMSFKSALQYQRLMQESLMWTVLEFVKRWADEKVEAKLLPKDHCLFDRLAGKSEYCQHVFCADEQAAKTRKEFDHHAHAHRYTVMNYCYGRTQTVECRLLPMMPSADLAVEAINHLMQIVSAFLVKDAKRELPISNAWTADFGTKSETVIATL